MSRKSLARSVVLEVGQRVVYTPPAGGERLRGTLAYGPSVLHVKPGEHDWCGIILDRPVGKNNGTVDGRFYFDCADRYGMFVRASCLTPSRDSNTSRIPSNRSQSSTPGLASPQPTSSLMTLFTIGSTPLTMTPSTSQTSIAGIGADMSRSSDRETTPEKRDDVRHMVERFQTKQEVNVNENIDQTLVHKPESVTSPAPLVSHEMIEELKEKVKDLQSKLDTLLVRRAQDKEKMKDYERLKIQCDQLVENKRQMSDKVAELSKAKASAEKEAKEAREEQMRHAEEMKRLGGDSRDGDH